MKANESNQMIKEKITIFEEVLEFIDTKEIEQEINKIIKNPRLSGLLEDIREDANSSKISFNPNEIKQSKFPCYNGSFKDDLNKFLKSDSNRDLNSLYQCILKEIQKVYHGYTVIENKLYIKINQMIQFSDSSNNTPMQITTKLKEIYEILEETIKYIESYLFKNFQTLQKVFYKIDEKLSKIYDVESVSLFFLLDIFDLPNNELSYIMMFKIIDEETCIFKYIIEILDNQIINSRPKNNIQDSIELNSIDNEECLLDSKSSMSSAAFDAMLNIKNNYINQINESINLIDSYPYFRAKYYNKYIYTKGNYEVDTNLFLNYIIKEDHDDNNEEFLPINSLMDEEVIIKKFIKNDSIKKFLDFFKSQMPSSFKRNEFLIMLHSIQYTIISVFVIFWYNKFEDGILNIFFYYIGKILSKNYVNYSIKKRNRIKNLFIFSNIIMIISLILEIAFYKQSYYKWIILCSRLLFGLSYSKNIETKFIINYAPKLLVRKIIKKYFSLSLLSLSFGFFLTSAFNYIFKNKDDIDDGEKKLNINNIEQIIFVIISFLILIFNVLIFKEPRISDIMKIKKKEKKEENKAINEITGNIPESNEKTDDKKDAKSIFSYGKAKLISFKEKNKAKLLEQSLKMDIGKKNYEGTNQIYNILQKLIIIESTSNSSYTNKATKGHILLYTLLYIISSIIIFYNPLYNSIEDKEEISVHNSKNKIWILGIPYLLSYLIYLFKLIRISSDIYVWNVIIFIFLCFEICLSFIFSLFDKTVFDKSPLDFDNYYFYIFLSLILFFNILIEIYNLKVMIREIPIEKKISSLNIDNFLDIYECLIKALTFGLLYIFIHYSVIKKRIFLKIIIGVLYLTSGFIFICYNYKRKQVSLIKIINKVTYESF